MFVVLTEDETDFDTFKVLIRRLSETPNMPIGGRGYQGCGDMLNKGGRYLRALAPPRHHSCIVVYDSDGEDEAERAKTVRDRIFGPAGLPNECCVVVPREEVEAWVLADLEAIGRIVPRWTPPKEIASPENLPSPKEYLHRLSRDAKLRPRLTEANNPALAKHLRLEEVERKCPSFKSFAEIVRRVTGK